MKCTICEQIKDNKHVLGQTENLTILLAQEPAANGHIVIVPRQHAPIAEQVPDNVIAEMFTTANTLSSQLFEQLGVQGTNLLLQNGLAAGQTANHVTLNIIPRKESDGINLEWQAKQISDDEMNQLAATIKAESEHIGKFEKEIVPVPQKPIGAETVEESEGEVDYMIQQLKRIP